WELPIFFKGYEKQLTEDDLYGPLKEHESKKLGDIIEAAWDTEIKTHKDPSLWRILRKVFGLEFVIYGLILIPIELVFRMSQPLLVGKLLKYYAPNQTKISKNEAYLYASLIVLMTFFYVLVGHTYALGVSHLGMKIRVACSSLIYRKSLKLSQSALVETTVGQMVNLLSNDVNKFDFAVIEAHFLWMGPLETLIILYFLYVMLGATAVVGIAVLLTFIPIKASAYFRAINMTCSIFLSRTAIYFCILTYVMTGHSLDPEYIYVLGSFYSIIRLGSVIFLPSAMIFLGETITSVKRIQKFLANPEIDQCEATVDCRNEIGLDQVCAKWDNSSSDYTLSDITLTVKPNQLIAIIGPVGSGKSTILQVFLKEIVPSQGTLHVGASVSYASQEPWIFGGSIKDNILFGERLDKIKYDEVVRVCALETDFSIFPYGDRTLVGERGVMLSGGQKARINLARAIYKDSDLYLLDDPLSAVDVNVGKQLFENCIRNYLRNKSRVLVTHQLQYLKTVDLIYLVENGRITASGTYQELKDSDNEFLKLLESEDKEEEEVKESTKTVDEEIDADEPSEVKESQGSGAISDRVYRNYFKAGGNILVTIFVILLHFMVQLTANGTDYFLSFWVNYEQSGMNGTLSSDDCLYIFSAMNAFLILITLFCMLKFFSFCIKASTRLHNEMFFKIVHMSMRFFNTNPSGRILNRFSKDIGLIDENLPISMSDTIEIGLNIIAITAVISIINPWILIPTVIMFVLFYFYRNVYLATSRNLKRIEGRTRSPIFSHITASLQGLATIRASNAQTTLRTEFDNSQDLHSSSYYMFLACDGAFGFWLDFFCVIYLGLVTLSFLFIGSETYGANVGLSVTQSIMMTGLLQYGMKQWSQLENEMTSVERVVEYSELCPEVDDQSKSPPPSWPSAGKIVFKSVSLRYAPEDLPVLKDLSFEISSTEKVGIVGRTGAGKSSLVSVFFRLAPVEGDIFIDGINTKTLALECLRSKISIIPQEPVLFSGTIRNNLDPFDEYQDEQLWNALDEVELKTVVADSSSGLVSKVTEGGLNFSVGQRQLLCLARALVRMNKILILDEATANVDPQTDELIQATIRRKFKDCTVLTIAHRLHTVMDCDRILVMDAGKVVEFDLPSKLLDNAEGVFYNLMQQTGREVAKKNQ
ncbi:ABC tran domain containing protein, partial [Asbolus verrucosus]